MRQVVELSLHRRSLLLLSKKGARQTSWRLLSSSALSSASVPPTPNQQRQQDPRRQSPPGHYYSSASLSLLERNSRLSSSTSFDSSIVQRNSATTTTATRFFSSSSTLSPTAADNDDDDDVSLYIWGTDQKGSLLQNVPNVEAASSSGEDDDTKKESTTTSTTTATMLDIPTKVNWRALLPPEESSSSSSTTDDDASLVKVLCGPSDTALLLNDGRCYVAGLNKQGQLGVGHKQPVPTLTKLNVPFPIANIVLGNNFSAIQDTDGELYTCGFGGSLLGHGIGQLGQGNGESYLEPTLVESLVEDGVTATEVQVGEAHMTVLTNEGEVLCCGAGSYGRLGSNFDSVDQLYLEPVELLTSGVETIAGGKSFTLGLKDGIIHGWGRNHKGQLGVGLGLAVDMYAMEQVPAPLESDELVGRRVSSIHAGPNHGACITSTGEVFLWGMSLHLEPFQLRELMTNTIVHVACGDNYTLCLTAEGQLYSLGQGGQFGVLGQASVKQLNQAALMESLASIGTVTQVSAGWKHAACLVQEKKTAAAVRVYQQQ